jgi:hypothetical protein
MAAESGLRSHVLIELRYRHVAEDLETGTIPTAVRLEPRFYVGKKAAGYTFLGAGSMRLLNECIEDRLVEPRPDPRLIPRSYYGVWAAIYRAKNKAGLDSKIQTCHGFRKYFENALDEANVDHEKKMMIGGHFAGTRARHYTDRDVEELRELYCKAYPFIALAPEYPRKSKGSLPDYHERFLEIESKLARQNILESKLLVLEDEMEHLKDLAEKKRTSDLG